MNDTWMYDDTCSRLKIGDEECIKANIQFWRYLRDNMKPLVQSDEVQEKLPLLMLFKQFTPYY